MKINADMLIFDVDGVLIDTCDSFCKGSALTIKWCWENILEGVADSEGYTLDYFRAAKRHPSFNDDVDIAWAILHFMEQRAGIANGKAMSCFFPSLEEWAEELRNYDGQSVRNRAAAAQNKKFSLRTVAAVFEEIYYGDEQYARLKGQACYGIKGQGLWKIERPGLSCHWKDLPLPSGIYTGRSDAEMVLAKDILAWRDFPQERIVSSSSGISKPSPEGFQVLCERIGAYSPLYFGDTASDKAAWQNFGHGTFVAIGDLLPNASLCFESLDSALKALF